MGYTNYFSYNSKKRMDKPEEDGATYDFRGRLLSAQKTIGAIKKDSDNPFYKSKYADINSFLAVVKPILNSHNIIILQPVLVDESGRNRVVTQLLDANSEEMVSSGIVLGEYPDPQKLGSAITYYRRYTLQSLLALEAEDDDGNSASSRETVENKVLKPTKKAPKEPEEDNLL